VTSLKTKLFCSCPSDYRGKAPNTVVCPTCLGLPGSLPVLNRRAVEEAVKVALALNCEIPRRTIFYRKNYYYPDMVKNFQISQYDYPIGVGGKISVKVNGGVKEVGIKRVHLEEDPGKLVYKGSIEESPYTLVDYNRAGIALLEIVTEPVIKSPREARLFLQKLQSILEHLGVSDSSLEGAMRCDANISIAGGARIEVKNISSFKEVEKALAYEIIRQRSLLRMGRTVERETRHWDEVRQVTASLRTKEEEMDYRYFPEPDLVPIELTEEFISSIKKAMPELPDARRERFMKVYGLNEYEAEVLVSEKSLADFYEETVKLHNNPGRVCHLIIDDLLGILNLKGLSISNSKAKPEHVAQVAGLLDNELISIKMAKYLLKKAVETGSYPEDILKAEGLKVITDKKRIENLVNQVFKEHPEDVEAAVKDDKVIHHLVGLVMKLTRGQADPALTYEYVKRRVNQLRKTKAT